MLAIQDSASYVEGAAAVCDGVVRNRVVSACGRFESFDLDGIHFELDWDDQGDLSHEQVMEEMRLYCEELERQP